MNFNTAVAALVAIVVCLSIPATASKSCSEYSSCISCTNTTYFEDRTGCRWCSKRCLSVAESSALCGSSEKESIRFDDMCPVSHPAPTPYLSDWMKETMDVIGDLPLLQLSLPGTHDTLTYDLSNKVSDGGIDDMDGVAKILHKYEKIIPDDIEDFIRQQAETHDLTITEQLDNGIRFFDFRIMYEYSDPNPAWFSLHCVQSNNQAMTYLQEVKTWMTAHTSEVVVLWLSKHGSTSAVGVDQFPNVTVAQKQAFWGEIVSLFQDVLVDVRAMPVNSTSVKDMVAAGKRLVVYASDYVEFTGSSTYALNAASIKNELSPGSYSDSGLAWQRDQFSNAQSTIDDVSREQGFFLVSLASGGGGSVPAMLDIRFLHGSDKQVQKCAATYNIPGMAWCPPTLLDQAQLLNYYSQTPLEEAVTKAGWRLPNAIYINGVDWFGTIRTGTRVLWGADRSDDAAHATTGYAYVDTFILSNLNTACGSSSPLTAELKTACGAAIEVNKARRAKFPISFWNDVAHGRLESFP